MGTSVGQVDLDLNLNQQGFTRQLSKMQSSVGDSMGAFASKIGGLLAAAFSVSAIVSFTKSCLDLGSDLNEVQNVVDVTFGDMAEQVNDWAAAAMTSFGLSEKCAKDYVGTLGAMAKSFGFTTEEAYNQATALAGLSADVASFYNLSTDEAYTKLKAVYTGETEGLKSLGVVMTQTALDEFALAQGWGKTTNAMTEAEKVELRLAYVTQTLSGAAGDFARTSDGWANQTKVLSLRFDALKASLGQGFINVLTPVLRLLNQLLAKLQVAAEMFRDFTAAVFGDANAGTSAAAESAEELSASTQSAAESAEEYKRSVIGIDTLNKLAANDSESTASSGSSGSIITPSDAASAGEMAGNIFDGILDKFKAMLGSVKNYFVKNFGGIFDNFFSGAKTNASRTAGIFKNLWNTLKSNFPNFADWFNGGFTDMLKTAAEVGGKMFNGIWDSANLVFGDLADNVFPTFTETLTTAILPSLSTIGTEIINTGGVIFDEVKGLFDSIWTDAVSPIIANMTTCWGDMWRTFSDWISGDGQSLFDGINAIFSGIGDALQYLWDEVLAPCFDWISGSITPFYNEHLKPLFDKVLDFFTTAGEYVSTMWNDVLVPAFQWAVNVFGPTVQTVIETIWTAVQNVFAIICDVIGGIIEAAGGLADFIAGVFTGDWERAWEGIKTFFIGIWDAIWGAIKGVINGMIGAINSLWKLLVSTVEGIANGIGGFVSQIGDLFGQDWGWTVDWGDIPTIPYLAQGGYVAANTPQLAVIGDNKNEGEIVAPESKIAQAVTSGITAALSQLGQLSGGNTTVVVELDGDVIGQAVTDYNRRQLARGNGY